MIHYFMQEFLGKKRFFGILKMEYYYSYMLKSKN